jgi:poly(3-hydroxybutyrate) depolymerase
MLLSSLILGNLATASVFIDGVFGQKASLQKVSSFGVNPTRLEMLIHTPPKLAENPPIILMVCAKQNLATSFVDAP